GRPVELAQIVFLTTQRGQCHFTAKCPHSIKEIGVTKCDKYGTLALNLDNEFNALCTACLNKGVFPSKERIVLKPISREEPITIKNSANYLAAHVANRKVRHRNDGVH